MPAIYPVVIYDAQAKEHRPAIPNAEVIDPNCIPISHYPGNGLRANLDGVYFGDNSMPPLLFVDGVDGVDAPLDPNGNATTVKTLDYALSQVALWKPKSVTLLLKCGQTFTLAKPYALANVDLTIGYFGDPKYGRGGPYGMSRFDPTILYDLQRPVISSIGYLPDSGFWSMYGVTLTNSKLTLNGLRLEIPDTPPNLTATPDNYSVQSDMFISYGSTVNMNGVLVNRNDPTSIYGFLGLGSRTRSKLTQYASQFLVANQRVDYKIVNTAMLQGRMRFIKFYPDQPTYDSYLFPYSMTATAVGSTESTALLDLMWSLCSSMPDMISGSESLGSFPLADFKYGVSNYILGIQRDQQHRPLNISCNTLL